MRIIDTKITKEILTGDNHPQLKIADKLYTVDDRQSTFDKIQNLQANSELSEKERTHSIYSLALGEEATKEIEELEGTEKDKKIYELALGKEAAEEIYKLDLPVSLYRYFSFCVMGAITGEDPDELQKMAREQVRKN